jgi:cytochrome P450
MTVTETPVEFDPFSEQFFNDPTEVYRRLRDEAPVFYSEKYGFYALSRFADVLAAHRDWEGFSSAHGVELFTLSKDPEEIRGYRNIIMMDPPEHDRFRALVSRVFTPRAVTALEPMIREVVCSFLDPLSDAREFDAVADFAAPFPVEVISRMLGVPEGDRQEIRHRIDVSLHREAGQTAPSPENQQAVLENGVYFRELTVEKRKNPGDDMLSRLTQVTVDRGDGVETGLGDHRLRLAPRWGRGRDGHEARRERAGAVLAAFGSVAEDPRRPREDPAGGRGDPPVLAAVPVPGPVLRAGARARERDGPRRVPRAPHHRRGDT